MQLVNMAVKLSITQCTLKAMNNYLQNTYKKDG